VLELDTPQGPARVHLEPAGEPVGALVLGHGAGGGVTARDLKAAAAAAREVGATVALVEQPYRVAGRKTPPAAPRLDEAWEAIVTRLAADELRGLPLVTGGRSSGARVACRTAVATGAAGVLCLAFPLHPPGRPEKTRQPELDAAGVPALVVQGDRDPFGMPAAGPGVTLVTLPGDHRLAGALPELRAAVRDWLPGVLGA